MRTIVQTFFTEVQLLILDTKDCQDLRFVDLYSALGFGPDDTEIFYISRGRADFYFSSSFSSTTDGIDAFIV